MEKFKFEEVNIDEVEVLESSITPGLGIVCGNGCWGFWCTGI